MLLSVQTVTKVADYKSVYRQNSQRVYYNKLTTYTLRYDHK